MLITSNTKFIRKYIAIAIGLLLTSVYSVQANAQTNLSQSRNVTTPVSNPTPNNYDSGYLEGIEAGDSNWGFSSASESKSLDDNLNKLGQYNVSDSESDKKDVIIDRSWGNQGDVIDRSIKAPVYKF